MFESVRVHALSTGRSPGHALEERAVFYTESHGSGPDSLIQGDIHQEKDKEKRFGPCDKCTREPQRIALIREETATNPVFAANDGVAVMLGFAVLKLDPAGSLALA